MDMFPQANRIKREDINPNPKKMLIVKPPKTGGTRLVGDLEDNHIIDLDGSSDFYETKAVVFDTKKEWKKFNASSDKKISYAGYVVKYIYHLNEQAKKNGPIAKYGTLDTVTEFEEIAKELALVQYKKTAMGKSFQESDISLLPMGAGYGRIRQAFKILYDLLEPCFSECLIFIAHPKTSSITVAGKELQATDVALTGEDLPLSI